jgi:hypothetical protein
MLYFVVMLVCGVKKFETFQDFFGVLLMCGANNHKLHDLCACVDVWKQQLISLLFSLWLCQCFKLFALYGCVDMGKPNKDCVNDMTQKEGPLD